MKTLQRTLIAFFIICIGLSVEAQNFSLKPIEKKKTIFFTGGIKRNLAERTKLEISAIPDNNMPAFTQDALLPEVKNTFSVSVGVEKIFTIGSKYHVSAEAALDMMQLNIVSGIKKRYTTTSGGMTFNSYSTNETNQSIPRLKIGFGFDVLNLNINDCKLTVRGNVAQLISVKDDLPNYSVVGLELRTSAKYFSVFLKGSMMPYNIQIKNIENYVGDLNAKVLRFETAYRFKELQAGLSVPL